MREIVTWIDDEQGVVHADGAHGDDRVPCGDALEGECEAGSTMEGMRESHARKITCDRCIRVIDRAKSVPARWIEREKGANQ